MRVLVTFAEGRWVQAPKEVTLSVLRRKKDFSRGFSTRVPNTPTKGAERTAADLRRLRRAPGRGSLCWCLQFEALVRVCVFVLLLVSLCPSFFLWLVGCLWVYGFSFLFGPLGHLLVCFFLQFG